MGDIRWIPFSCDNPSYLSVKGDLEITQGRIFEARYNFWQNLMKRIKRREMELEICDHNGLETSISEQWYEKYELFDIKNKIFVDFVVISNLNSFEVPTLCLVL